MSTRAVWTGVLVLGMGLAACSGDDGDGSGGSPFGKRQLNVESFKNSATPEGFKQKGKAAGRYFADMEKVKMPFLASGAGNNLMGRLMGLAAPAPQPGSAEVMDPEAGTCSSQFTEEETPSGELLFVETKTCVNETENGTVTCVTVTKESWGGSQVQKSSTCSSQSTESSRQEEPSSDVEVDVASQYVPDFGSVTDCKSAFETFDETYRGIKTEYDNVFGMLTNPNGGLNLASAGLSDVGTLKEAENDDKAALTYEFVAPSEGGVKMSGKISGGANETTVLLRQNVSVAFDMASMLEHGFPGSSPTPTGSSPSMEMAMDLDDSIAIDDSLKLIEQEIAMSSTVKTDTLNQATTLKGLMTLSAGDEKYVRTQLDIGSQADSEGFATRLDLEARLADANTLTFRASVTGQGEGAGSGEVSFDLVKTGQGQCEVRNQKNTLADDAAH